MTIPSGGARIVVTYGFDTGRLGTVADLDADAGWVPVQLDCAPHAAAWPPAATSSAHLSIPTTSGPQPAGTNATPPTAAGTSWNASGP